MARPTTVHVCSSCGHEAPRWAGQCTGCGEWNTLVEEVRSAPARGGGGGSGRAGVGGSRGGAAVTPTRLGAVEATEVARLPTGIGELDRVLGGGIVPGSLVLIGGSPGIGKSTLTTMALANLTGAGRKTLYVSAEESAAQIKLRAERLPGAALDIPVIAETDLGAVLATLERERPDVCVVDSVQTLHASELTGAPGSVGQVREVAGEIMRVAKQHRIAVLLVGHVTKEGALAGPRVLEHLVDCVLQFEGERERTYRTLRALKNRFGSTSEAGVFEMRQGGLVEVLDASARFVGEATHAPGSVVLCAMEGSRPLLVEVQALVSQSELVPPRRVVSGIDRNRLALVLAVLTRHGGVALGAADVFVNVVGGVRVDEPGADLAVALAVASAARGVALRGGVNGGARGGRDAQRSGADAQERLQLGGGERTEGAAPGPPLACFGELGLTGELRTVAHPERRIAEAAKFGLGTIVTPEAGTLRAALRSALPAQRRPQAA
ncbi:DNA repair protein RadA [Conexibacter sp. CPCC 206217]|uniref:DNA repair protein RadA n=1 Tax=Conexibacter sp. CPCC 206217 TaxID=3064574 RepID=UPI0027265EDA|nr:DNA repair protein RadA [Conexibacter sp. CPCC 206217]MDO8209351.1 DNA repair protein RadA [Conexibacter sp. CPCC 206217]